MTTARDIVQFIRKHITYKPGYKLEAHLLDHEHMQLSMTMPCAPDSDGVKPGLQSLTYCENFNVEFLVRGWHEQGYLVFRIGEFLARWEQHERDEWFKVDGVRVHEPHQVSVNCLNGEKI